MVGQVDPSKGYIHILDDTTFDILLKTLDTVADFVAYLTKKERFIDTGRILAAAGEEELLAYYLTHTNDAKEYDFVVRPDINALTIDEGFWQDFVRSPQRISQLRANTVSYLWDELIERFTLHFREGTSNYQSETNASAHELILRFFAREPRIRRRMLSAAIIDMLRTTPPEIRRLRVFKPSRAGDPFFVLLLLPIPSNRPYEEYRQVRRKMLEICCHVVKLDFPEAVDIVGFATETAAIDGGRSEDAVYLDARNWTEELSHTAREDKLALKLLTNATIREGTEYDYPI